MIKWSWTIFEHSWRIFRPVRSIDCNCDRLHCNWCCQCTASIGNSDDSSDLECASICLASLLSGNVGISTFCCYSFVNDIFHSTSRPSSIASLIAIAAWTIDELLVWKVKGFFLFYQGPRLTSGSRSKGPACTTRTLIFDTCNSTFCSPINVTVGNFVWFISVFDILLLRWHNHFW